MCRSCSSPHNTGRLFHPGFTPAPHRLTTSYLYTRFYDSLEAVANRALGHFSALRARAIAVDAELESSALSVDQKWQLAHSVRAYFGSTQLLDTVFGKPLWVVNEGEYRYERSWSWNMHTFNFSFPLG